MLMVKRGSETKRRKKRMNIQTEFSSSTGVVWNEITVSWTGVQTISDVGVTESSAIVFVLMKYERQWLFILLYFFDG